VVRLDCPDNHLGRWTEYVAPDGAWDFNRIVSTKIPLRWSYGRYLTRADVNEKARGTEHLSQAEPAAHLLSPALSSIPWKRGSKSQEQCQDAGGF